MFIFKKIFSQFFFPLPLVVYIFLAALILLWFTRKQKAGKILVSIGILILMFFSYGGVSNTLLKRLERQYSTLDINSLLKEHSFDKENPIRMVVVLAGGHSIDPNIPLTSKLKSQTLVRLIEGIRIYREIPGSKLLLSGGGPFSELTEADVMKDVAMAIGVSEDDIIIESESKDTKDQARMIEYFVNDDPFILVTSASHMPRSLAMFKKLGMNPIPMPTGHQVRERQNVGIYSFFPRGKEIVKSENVFYEYLGLMWAKLRGQI